MPIGLEPEGFYAIWGKKELELHHIVLYSSVCCSVRVKAAACPEAEATDAALQLPLVMNEELPLCRQQSRKRLTSYTLTRLFCSPALVNRNVLNDKCLVFIQPGFCL